MRNEKDFNPLDLRKKLLDLPGIPKGGLRRNRSVDELESSNVKLRAQVQKLRRESKTDQLTGLPNRRGLNERLEIIRGRHPEEPEAVLFLDYDRFKDVNDTYGHPTGDSVLRKLGRMVRDKVRPDDEAAAISKEEQGRYGGEEVVVVMRDISDPQMAVKRAEDIRKKVEQTSFKVVKDVKSTGVKSFHGTVSIGVSSGRGEDIHNVLSEADKALYAAKQGGRNQVVVFDKKLHSEIKLDNK